MSFELIDYKPEYQTYFERFNKAWLEKYFEVEPLDKWVLERPEEAILENGGRIFFAAVDGQVIGTVALRFFEDGVYELTKMAVDQNWRGHGAGQFLCSAAIEKAREMGMNKLILYSNSVLENALHIYRKLGFVDIPVVTGTYERSDIMMEMIFNNNNIDIENIALSQQEIQQLRAETRGTTERIHFNNAGASMPPDAVVDTMVKYLQEEATFGGYETEAKYIGELEHTYELIAKLINAGTDEVAIVENASKGWGLAFHGLTFKEGDEIITSEMEYVSNLLGFLNAKKSYGAVVKVIPNDDEGNLSVAALENAISSKTKLIAITHVPSTSGSMTPVVEIGKVARKHNILYLVDACQAIGQCQVDVKEIDCDMLAVTGRKYLRGPRGTGFMYVRKSVQDQLKVTIMDDHATEWVTTDDFKLRDDARRFELYEKNRALTLGLNKAISYALNVGIDRIWQRIQLLSGSLRQQLNSIDGITVYDKGSQLSGIVTFSVAGLGSADVKKKLAEKHINVSVGKAVSTLLYMNRQQLKTVIRASVHYYNTEEELTILCNALVDILKQQESLV